MSPAQQLSLFLLRLFVLLALPGLLLLVQPQAENSFVWDWANVLGYLCVFLMLALFVFNGRPGNFPRFSGRFFYNIHRDLGVLCCAFGLLHMAILWWHEPLLYLHFLPTAPLGMLAALLAIILSLLLSLTALHYFRLRWWPSYLVFRRWHLLLAVAVVLMVIAHILKAGFYLAGPVEYSVAGLCMVLLAWHYWLHRNAHGFSGEKHHRAQWSGPAVVFLAVALLFASVGLTLCL